MRNLKRGLDLLFHCQSCAAAKSMFLFFAFCLLPEPPTAFSHLIVNAAAIRQALTGPARHKYCTSRHVKSMGVYITATVSGYFMTQSPDFQKERNASGEACRERRRRKEGEGEEVRGGERGEKSRNRKSNAHMLGSHSIFLLSIRFSQVAVCGLCTICITQQERR